MNNLTKKTALVTGGAQGLGKAISTTLATAGAEVFVADIALENAQKTADEITAAGGTASALNLNIADEASMKDYWNRLSSEGKKLDILINNAGVDVTKPIHEISVEEIDRVLNINLRGTFLMTKFALEHMYQNKSGHVVNVASTAAKRAWANASAYHASKWGLIGLSRGLYVEAREYQVKVSVIVPGGMRTPFILERFPDTPLDKLQDPQKVADVIKFILEQPADTIIPEVMVIPMQESSWP